MVRYNISMKVPYSNATYSRNYQKAGKLIIESPEIKTTEKITFNHDNNKYMIELELSVELFKNEPSQYLNHKIKNAEIRVLRQKNNIICNNIENLQDENKQIIDNAIKYYFGGIW